jgi:hypothetical protein
MMLGQVSIEKKSLVAPKVVLVLGFNFDEKESQSSTKMVLGQVLITRTRV